MIFGNCPWRLPSGDGLAAALFLKILACVERERPAQFPHNLASVHVGAACHHRADADRVVSIVIGPGEIAGQMDPIPARKGEAGHKVELGQILLGIPALTACKHTRAAVIQDSPCFVKITCLLYFAEHGIKQSAGAICADSRSAFPHGGYPLG